MNAERLLQHCERIADAPDAIARLRRFILDLAVRGKLVPQDANDEPALELLKRIAKEKARLVKAGEIKDKPLPPVDGDADFEVPPTWRWTRLGTVTSYIQRGKSPKYAASDGSLVVSQKCIQWSGLDLSVAKQVTLESLGDYEDIRFLRYGDLLWNSTGTGTIGRIIRLVDPPEKLVCDSHVTVVRCLEVEPEYIRAWLRSDHVYALIEDRAAGSTNQVELTAQMAINQVVPLPPLAEQHRIVAKVDELMGLCDRLEAARAGREAVRDRLAAASLARLNAPDPETFQADARFALDVLPALTTRPDQIKHLRQTILNLAVRGKLVPQDPNDEPASELLKQIAGEIPASKGQSQIGEPLPYAVPEGWAWINLGMLVAHSDAGWSPKTEDFPRSGDAWGVLKVSAVSWDKFRAWENKQVLKGTEARLQAEVKQGDFLISRANTAELIARAVIVDEQPVKLMMSDKIVRLLLSKNCNHRFVWIVNNYADFARAHYVERASGVSPSMKNVSRDVILGLPFPLPPLAEQHRIVAKVDALMALCDRLEASLTATAATRRRLLDALLAEALAPGETELEAAE
jgi:type I restriction enzyme S subunit